MFRVVLHKLRFVFAIKFLCGRWLLFAIIALEVTRTGCCCRSTLLYDGICESSFCSNHIGLTVGQMCGWTICVYGTIRCIPNHRLWISIGWQIASLNIVIIEKLIFQSNNFLLDSLYIYASIDWEKWRTKRIRLMHGYIDTFDIVRKHTSLSSFFFTFVGLSSSSSKLILDATLESALVTLLAARLFDPLLFVEILASSVEFGVAVN